MFAYLSESLVTIIIVTFVRTIALMSSRVLLQTTILHERFPAIWFLTIIFDAKTHRKQNIIIRKTYLRLDLLIIFFCRKGV